MKGYLPNWLWAAQYSAIRLPETENLGKIADLTVVVVARMRRCVRDIDILPANASTLVQVCLDPTEYV